MARDERARPSHWPDWYPIRCPSCGAPFVAGAVRMPWVHCDCPGAGEARGHEVLHCVATPGCRWKRWPPEHVPGTETAEPPRV